MQFTILALLPVLTAALPTSNLPRAGGPSITPIPSNCTVSDPLTQSPESNGSLLPADGTSSSLLYSAYYPSNSDNTTQMADQCLQQCYGYGSHTECKSAFWAESVKTPAGYYGGPGGELMTACLLYKRALTDADFETAPEGQGTSPFARNLACPAAAAQEGSLGQARR